MKTCKVSEKTSLYVFGLKKREIAMGFEYNADLSHGLTRRSDFSRWDVSILLFEILVQPYMAGLEAAPKTSFTAISSDFYYKAESPMRP